MRQVLRDKSGNRLGEIRPTGALLVAYGRSGQRLGYYNPAVNVTYDPQGRRIGIGNYLSGLIFDAR